MSTIVKPQIWHPTRDECAGVWRRREVWRKLDLMLPFFFGGVNEYDYIGRRFPATIGGTPDVINGKIGRGVQFVASGERYEFSGGKTNYGGHISLVTVVRNLDTSSPGNVRPIVHTGTGAAGYSFVIRDQSDKLTVSLQGVATVTSALTLTNNDLHSIGFSFESKEGAEDVHFAKLNIDTGVFEKDLQNLAAGNPENTNNGTIQISRQRTNNANFVNSEVYAVYLFGNSLNPATLRELCYDPFPRRRTRTYWIFTAAAPGPIVVTPTSAAINLNADDPTVSLGALSVTPTEAAINLNSDDATISVGALSVTPTEAAINLTANDPTLSLGAISVTPTTGALPLVADDSNLSLGALAITPAESPINLNADLSSVTLGTGPITVTPTEAVINLTANDPTLSLGAVTVTPTTAALPIIADDSNLSLGAISVTPTEAALALTANDPTLALALEITPASAVLVLTADDPTVSVGAATVTPDSAVIKLVAENSAAIVPSLFRTFITLDMDIETQKALDMEIQTEASLDMDL